MPYKNPQDKIDNVRKWVRNNRSKHLRTLGNSQRKYKYGISASQYNAMLEMQRGVCAICGKSETRVIRGKILSLSVDHCHNSKKIRGLLCSACNSVLGHAFDSVDILKAAIDYLIKAGV